MSAATQLRCRRRSGRASTNSQSVRSSDESIAAAHATPSDYLEKIFQIPFWLRHPSEESVKRMVRSLVREGVAAAPSASGKIRVTSPEHSAVREQATVFKKRQHDPNASLLDVLPAELEYIEHLAPLPDRLPRALKRFVNVYRLVKAGSHSHHCRNALFPRAWLLEAANQIIPRLWHGRMDAAFQRRKFTELRFEYYVSGRMLWFSDTMSIAAMLLDYAVELSLKYALITVGVTHNGLLHSHKPLDLFLKCMEAGGNTPGSGIHRSPTIHFRHVQRYPSQVVKTSAEANARGHALGQSLDLILAYDDLVNQLDDALRERCSDDSVSIGLLGAHFVNRPQGRGFFHCNVAALKNTLIYRDLLEKEHMGAEEQMRKQGLTEETIYYNLQNQRQQLKTWEGAPSSIWNYQRVSTAISPDFPAARSRAREQG